MAKFILLPFCMRFIVFFVFVMVVSGCGRFLPIAEKTTQQELIHDNNTVGRTLSIKKINSVPCLENCTSTHVGYARGYDENLLRTVSHILPKQLDQIIIDGPGSCGIQYLWLHPTQDLALIQTTGPCIPGIQKGLMATGSVTQGVFSQNNSQKTVLIEERGSFLFVAGLTLAPGMSGSPIVTQYGEVVGLVHAQAEQGVLFTDLRKRAHDLLSLSEK